MKPMSRLEYHRRAKGLSRKEAAKKLGISYTTLQNYEHPVSRRRNIHKQIREAIETFYGYKWAYLRELCK